MGNSPWPTLNLGGAAMPAGTTSARQARGLYRHELRTLTYVTLDQANGGVVRNLSHNGIGIQSVTPMQPRQQVQVRFELRYPRVRVETRGEIVWSTFSGQCGIRLLDLPARAARQIDEWIMGNLLEGSIHAAPGGSMFGPSPLGSRERQTFGSMLSSNTESLKATVEDGLILSPAPVKIIELPAAPRSPTATSASDELAWEASAAPAPQDWLSQPLSARSLAWIVNGLVVIASFLLATLIFLSVTHELPRWPLATAASAGIVLIVLYQGFFRFCAGGSFGARLARLRDSTEEEEVEEDRFR